MSKQPRPPVFPRQQHQAETLGERIRLARLRRGISQEELAARVGVSRKTIVKLETGDASIGLAVLLRALDVLGLADHVDQLAARDEIGRRLEDLQRTRAPRRQGSRARSR